MPGYKIPESVLVLVHTTDLDVLLIERADRPGFWQSVTGSRDDMDEPLRDTAVRELREETGIVAGRDDLVDWRHRNRFEIFSRWRGRYAPGVTHNTEHVYSLALPARREVTLAPLEHVAYRWLPWREAAQAVFSWCNADVIRMLPRRAARMAGGRP